jgi:hypothetical protein
MHCLRQRNQTGEDQEDRASARTISFRNVSRTQEHAQNAGEGNCPDQKRESMGHPHQIDYALPRPGRRRTRVGDDLRMR